MLYVSLFLIKMYRISLVFIFSLFILSFLQVDHLSPWNNFYSNFFILASFFFLILILIQSYNEKFNIDKIAYFLLFFIITSFFQFFFNDKYFQDIIIQITYLILVFIIYVFFNNFFKIDDNYQNSNILNYFIWGFIISSIFSSYIGFYQFFNPWYGELWVFPLQGNRIYANLGQPNQLATLILLGILSVGYLNRNKNNILLILIPFFSSALYLTQSRTVWTFVIVGVIVLIIKKKLITKQFFIFFTFFIFCYFSNFYINFENSLGAKLNVSERLTSGYLRIEMWRDYIEVIKNNTNIVGHGWGSIEKLNFIYGSYSQEYFFSYHNIIFDMYVFFGIPALFFISFLIYKIYFIFYKIESIKELSLFIILLAFINHAMLEFPLYYWYFLFPFLVVFSYLNNSVFNKDNLILKIEKNFLIFIFFIIFISIFISFILYDKNRSIYRNDFLGICESNEKYYFFDRFKDVNYIVCYKVNNIKDLKLLEDKVLKMPSKNYLLKLIYIYDYHGLYVKRDFLLKKYRKKYDNNLTLDELRLNNFK